MKVVIFGATGGIGGAVSKLFKTDEVVKLGSRGLDFRSTVFKHNFEKSKYSKLVDDADLILNCAGVLGDPQDDYEAVFDVNFNSNVILFKHFMTHPPKNLKKFVMIGSSAYKNGRDDLMLYSASKAALFNLFQGAEKFFKNSKLVVGLINPGPVKTKMTAGLKGKFMTREECAKKIFDFTNHLKKSGYVDLK